MRCPFCGAAMEHTEGRRTAEWRCIREACGAYARIPFPWLRELWAGLARISADGGAKRCEGCGALLPESTRPNRFFCGANCRKIDFRRRQHKGMAA